MNQKYLKNSQHGINILMILAMISWGIAWANAKIVNQYLDYYNLTFLRFFVGFLSLIPFCIFKIFQQNFSYRLILNIFITSILFFTYNICFFKGTHFGDAGRGGVFVTTTNPLITFILASLISRKITLNQLVSIFLGVLGGLIIMDVIYTGFSSLFTLDNKYFILCSLAWGVMTIIMKYGQEEIDSLVYITLCYFATSLIAVLFIELPEYLTVISALIIITTPIKK